MDFPLIYCNGDSYSDENYLPELKGNIFVDFVAKPYNGFVINKSISGSCNRRILRTATHDLIQQRQLNPDQHIVALINLSFEIRSEVWIDESETDRSEESQFKPWIFTTMLDWRERLLGGKDIGPAHRWGGDKKFLRKYSEGRAYFYSPYAEKINLYTDLINFKNTLDALDIKFLIFRSVATEETQEEYLLDFLRQEIDKDKRVLDIEKFSWIPRASEQFIPVDMQDRPEIGHHGPDAHEEFAESILIPMLEETNQI